MGQEIVREAILEWLRAREQQMFDLLEEVVAIESGSYGKGGVDKVGAVFRAWFEAAGIATRVFPLPDHGDCLLAEVPGSAGADAPHVLLLGHMDTVFPDGTLAQRPYRVENGLAYGPGVADMKAGLVMNAFVARAFAEVGGNRAPIRVFFTGDEEIASPASRDLTLTMAKGASTVLNAEPGRPSGNVVVERKGAFFIDFEVDGVAAHSGVAHDKGASAIEAMARKIVGLHALTDKSMGVTANVGTIQGGVSVNTVAPHAKGQLDVRFPKGVDENRLRKRILNIIEGQSLACTCGRVTHEGRFLPLFQTDASRELMADYAQAAQELGLSVAGESTGGSADSGFTAAAGAPTLCATGPVGGHAHTPQEYCQLDTLVPRAQTAALTILARDPL
ncbi:M20 family metallopeptidase [Paralcaligenes sp. KSB-10]|uniref:M20 family metallopeptidase n=1 Tax=Paralcaligenes sp. KSB-10 TaxID=2901142 RepID=UPI001E5842FD|nr:M20 family metallopeptidase [Paralcaligenes sp. KSB-10]UHL63079.1 M20 family metallopeptidase [Paralcaligenes sp. KSB-10]